MRLPPHTVVHQILRQHFQEFRDLGEGSSVPGFHVEEMPGRRARVSFQPAFPFVYPFAWQQAQFWKRAIEAHYRVERQGPEEPVVDAVPVLIVHDKPSYTDMQEGIRLLRERFPDYSSPLVPPAEGAAYDYIQRLHTALEGKLAPLQIEEVWEATHRLLAGELPPYRRV